MPVCQTDLRHQQTNNKFWKGNSLWNAENLSLTRLFYNGNRDPFPCNWFQIGSLGVRSPNAPLDVTPSDKNASSAMEAYYSQGNNALMPSEGTGCTSELSRVIARQVPSLPRRLRGDNATELFSNQTRQIVELFAKKGKAHLHCLSNKLGCNPTKTGLRQVRQENIGAPCYC